MTFTQDEISFRGDAFEIAKDAAPTMLNGEGKIFFIELGHLTIGESTAPQAFKLVGNNIEIFISDTSLTPTAQSTLDIKATGYVKLHGGSILNPSATQLVGEPPVSVTSQINIEAAEILLDGYIPGKAVIDAADGHTISLTSKGNLSIKGDEALLLKRQMWIKTSGRVCRLVAKRTVIKKRFSAKAVAKPRVDEVRSASQTL